MNDNPHKAAELTSMLNLQVKSGDKREGVDTGHTQELDSTIEAPLGATIEAIDTSHFFKKS